MISILAPVALALTAGVCLVLQQALNGNLRMGLGSAVWAGFASYFVGAICMAAVVALFREPIPSPAILGRIPWGAWSGGLFGAIFIGLGILLVPKLGAATFFALLVGGQMLGSLIFDHFGLLGVPVQPFTLVRLLGAALLVGGVVLIRM